MTDFYCEVAKITKIEKHTNSDNLSVATVLNTPVIIRTGTYSEGQLVSYIGVEAIVPDTELFHFLAPPAKKDSKGILIEPAPHVGSVREKYRTIKSKKIRGTYSEGLIVAAPENFQEGQSLIEHFGIKRRDPEAEAPDASNEHGPSTFSLFKYDIEGLAKYGYVFQEGEEVLITEKLEGENYSLTFAEDRLWVRSRNYFKQDLEGSHWWEWAHRMQMEEKLKAFPLLAIWMEKYGHVPRFKYDCPMENGAMLRMCRVFDIWDVLNKKFLPWEEVSRISKALELNTVPVLYQGPWKNDGSLQTLAEGKSAIGEHIKEGWVMRSIPEGWHEKLGRKMVKYKGHDYKLAKE